MKRLITLLVFATLAAAQDKVSVPLSDPSQPATVKARLVNGSITVKSKLKEGSEFTVLLPVPVAQ